MHQNYYQLLNADSKISLNFLKKKNIEKYIFVGLKVNMIVQNVLNQLYIFKQCKDVNIFLQWSENLQLKSLIQYVAAMNFVNIAFIRLLMLQVIKMKCLNPHSKVDNNFDAST